MMVGKDLLYPQNLPNDLALLFHLLGERLSFIEAVVAHNPVQVLGPNVVAIHFALLLSVPLDAGVPLLPLSDAVAPEAPWQKHGEQLLHHPIPPTPEFFGVVRRRDEDGMLYHFEDVGISTAEELSPVIKRPGRVSHGSERQLRRQKHAGRTRTEAIANKTHFFWTGSRPGGGAKTDS